MKEHLPILSITGSDSTGGSGIQGDIKTIAALGGYALTVVTSVVVQGMSSLQKTYSMPPDVVAGQLRAVLGDVRPKAVKIGMLVSADVVNAVAENLPELVNVVYSPVLESSHGNMLVDEQTLAMSCVSIFPHTDMLIMKVSDASRMVRRELQSNEDIQKAAEQLKRMGPKNVLIYGGFSSVGLLTNILLTEEGQAHFFTLAASSNWKSHGLAATLSSAVATLLAKGYDVVAAASGAHDYIRSLMLYSFELQDGRRAQLLNRAVPTGVTDRHAQLYNDLMQLVAKHHKNQHDVLFYADHLCVTTRYLSQVTKRVSGKSPKALIDEYLMHEITRALLSTPQSVQAIAFEHGFCSQAQFAKFFKKHTNLSPTQFRHKRR